MTFSILSWNVGQLLRSTHVRSARVRRYLKKTNADVACLQECPEHEGLIGLGDLHRTETGADAHLTITRFPVLEHGLVPISDHCSHEINAYEHAAWKTLDIAGSPVRIYNCHFPIYGVGIMGRQAVLASILEHAEGFRGPVAICGDMNTTVPRAGIGRRIVQRIHHESDASMFIDGARWDEDERYAFARTAASRGFYDVLPIDRATWALPFTRWEVLGLKLDWVLVRGMRVTFERFGPYISDHRPVHVRCELS